MAASAIRDQADGERPGVDAAHLDGEHVEGEHGGDEIGRPMNDHARPGTPKGPTRSTATMMLMPFSITLRTKGVRVPLWA